MNRSILKNLPTSLKVIGASGIAVSFALLPLTGSAFAVTNSAAQTATQQQHLQTMITKGDAEINRRLTTLNSLTAKINAATKLSASDKTTLSNEVSSTISGLTTLKAKLDSETTLASAKIDVQDIYTQYRVYALVSPKVGLIKVADDQQASEIKLLALAQKLQTRINTAKQAGKDTTSLQSQLDDLNSKLSAAQAISPKVESSVINLEPTDYNSDHAILSGYNTQLKTARSDMQAAFADAKAIVSGLKSLK